MLTKSIEKQLKSKKGPHGTIVDVKKASCKTIRYLQQCHSPDCHGRIFCRDLQSSKMQAQSVIWGEELGDDDEDKKKYKYKKKVG